MFVAILLGENSGYVTLLSSRGEKMWRDKLHKSKVTNIQYSPREPWLFATTSTDNSVKIWDVRNLTDGTDTNVPRKERCLQTLEHDKPVNSAYFSHVDGTRLLTTDQKSQLRVYKGNKLHRNMFSLKSIDCCFSLAFAMGVFKGGSVEETLIINSHHAANLSFLFLSLCLLWSMG